jgi:serine/threonine protein phosphatase PrpC
VIQLGENLICANSGDSRAILIYNQKELLNLNNNNDKNNTTSKSNKMKDSETNFYQIKNIISPFSSYRNIFKNSLRASASVSSLDIKNLNKFTQRSSQRFSLNKITKIPDNTPKGIFCLSNDLKPTLPLEKQRIIENGGRVEQFIENDGTTNGPYRVWVQDEMYPGLAMSRSIGDFIASSVGVIPNPEIIEYNLNNSSKYMIIASDGIWQFMSNEKVMNIANQYYPKRDPIDMCNELIREANIAWDKEGIPRDDITVVVVYF